MRSARNVHETELEPPDFGFVDGHLSTHAMPAPLLVVAGLALLLGGATALVSGAASAALRLGLTPLLVGATVVAFGTSAPELVVSLDAAFDGAGGIAIGNVVGSNIANAALILGVAALIRPVPTEAAMLRRDLPVLMAATLVAGAMLWDGALGRAEGAVLLAALVASLVWSVRASRAEAREAVPEGVPDAPVGSAPANAAAVAVGLGALVLGARWLVGGATTLAQGAGVSNAVIGLSVVALGTSLPELATSVVAAVRGDSAIAAGNVVGSNLFNLLGILGLAALVHPFAAPGLRAVDVAAMLGATALVWLLMWTGRRIGRLEGGLLVALYGTYVGSLVAG